MSGHQHVNIAYALAAHAVRGDHDAMVAMVRSLDHSELVRCLCASALLTAENAVHRYGSEAEAVDRLNRRNLYVAELDADKGES
jgi:hypothetical protein